MPLPKSVKKQAEEAEKLAGETFNPPAEPASSEVGEQVPPEEPTPGEGTPPAETPPEAQEVTPPTTPDDWETRLRAIEEDLASTKTDLEKERHKYSVLQGKYNKEVKEPRDSMYDKVSFLEGKLASAEDFIRQNVGKVASGEVPPEEGFDSEQFERDYPDIYKALIALQKQSEKKLLGSVQNVERRFQESTLDSFYKSLSSSIEDWETINRDPDFLAWLQERERYSPYTRHQLLQESFTMGNPEVAINLFSDFKKLKEVNPSTPPEPEPTGKPTGTQGDMSKFASPPSSPRGEKSPGQSSGKKTYTQKEINDFYRNSALGRLRLTPEQKAAQEVEFWKAIAENRVIK